MKKETLRNEYREDGTYVIVEKTQQTPEDGFVQQKSCMPSSRKTKKYFKGYLTNITYTTNDSKMVYLFLLFAFLFACVFFIVSVSIYNMAPKNDPEIDRNLKMSMAAILLFIGCCFIRALTELKKQ